MAKPPKGRRTFGDIARETPSRGGRTHGKRQVHGHFVSDRGHNIFEAQNAMAGWLDELPGVLGAQLDGSQVMLIAGDGSQVRLPEGMDPTDRQEFSDWANEEFGLRVNTATIHDLRQTAGIGPGYAASIVVEIERNGPVGSIEELVARLERTGFGGTSGRGLPAKVQDALRADGWEDPAFWEDRWLDAELVVLDMRDSITYTGSDA